MATVLALGTAALPAPAGAANRVTPGNFTGYGFDQCLTPTQAAMDAWRRSSPFWAVGIYISGDSRACRNQPNQTRTWVATQLRKGWRLLPIALGPQASCNPRFPRYSDDETIDPSSANRYAKARRMGRAEAVTNVADAQRLGISPGSTLWYDMEAYDTGNTACRESALWFNSAWTKKVRALGYVAGVYSSAGSHLQALDDARVERPGTFVLPDRIWIARWDGLANTSTSYLRPDGWLPGNRMKQYRGGHNETWGGVTINIDSNWLDLGKGSFAGKEPEHCGGVRLSFPRYGDLRVGARSGRVSAAQCLLTDAGYDPGPIDGVMDERAMDAVVAYRTDHGLGTGRVVGRRVWTALHGDADPTLVKFGAAGERIRRLQRALNAAVGAELRVTGVFEAATTAAVKRYQAAVGMPQSGVVTAKLWRKLRAGTV